jgi:hypothetical protein
VAWCVLCRAVPCQLDVLCCRGCCQWGNCNKTALNIRQCTSVCCKDLCPHSSKPSGLVTRGCSLPQALHLPQVAATGVWPPLLLQLRLADRTQLLLLLVCAASTCQQLLAVLLGKPVRKANCCEHDQQESHEAQQQLLCQLLWALAAKLRANTGLWQCQKQWVVSGALQLVWEMPDRGSTGSGVLFVQLAPITQHAAAQSGLVNGPAGVCTNKAICPHLM